MFEMMNIFEDDAFSQASMTAAVNKRPYIPQLLESLGIFTTVPIRTEMAAVLIDDHGALQIIPTTPRGAPPYEQVINRQNIRAFPTPRIAVADTIRAAELQNAIARTAMSGGSPQMMLADVQNEIAYRLDGPGGGLRGKQAATKERMRLGAISGIVLDQDGSTIYNWPTEFGVALPAEIAFNLNAVTPVPGVLTNAIRALFRSILRAAKAGNLGGVRVIGLCGDAFFDALVTHPDVLSAYTLYQNSVVARLSAGQPNVPAFSLFPFGDIDWINYRGTDDNSTIAIATDKVKFVVTGVPGLFQEILSPGENFAALNDFGQPLYTWLIPDRDRDQFIRLETYSYPMYLATRPEMLFSGRQGA